MLTSADFYQQTEMSSLAQPDASHGKQAVQVTGDTLLRVMTALSLMQRYWGIETCSSWCTWKMHLTFRTWNSGDDTPPGKPNDVAVGRSCSLAGPGGSCQRVFSGTA